MCERRGVGSRIVESRFCGAAIICQMCLVPGTRARYEVRWYKLGGRRASWSHVRFVHENTKVRPKASEHFVAFSLVERRWMLGDGWNSGSYRSSGTSCRHHRTSSGATKNYVCIFPKILGCIISFSTWTQPY